MISLRFRARILLMVAKHTPSPPLSIMVNHEFASKRMGIISRAWIQRILPGNATWIVRHTGKRPTATPQLPAHPDRHPEGADRSAPRALLTHIPDEPGAIWLYANRVSE